VGSWSVEHVQRLFYLSRASHDVLVHLRALLATGARCDSLDSLAAAVLSGRMACLEPASVGLAAVLAFLTSPHGMLLTAVEKGRVGVPHVDRIIQLSAPAAVGSGGAGAPGDAAPEDSESAAGTDAELSFTDSHGHGAMHALRALVDLDNASLQFLSLSDLGHELLVRTRATATTTPRSDKPRELI